MAEDFFRRFDEEMQRRHPEAYAAEAAIPLPVSPLGEAASGRMPMWVWIAFGVVVLIALLLLAR
jgi:hypothetical protein